MLLALLGRTVRWVQVGKVSVCSRAVGRKALSRTSRRVRGSRFPVDADVPLLFCPRKVALPPVLHYILP
jgi:hypothetical protein